MELISIIVPIYNTEKYIRRCVNSIMCQTYRNLQIILVDDGSMDHSGMICDELAMQDKRIIVIHKMNGGLSDARNAGLEKAEGDYIGFVDSDDYVEEDMYETLYNEIGKKHADIVSCGYIERFPEYERTLGCQDVVLNKEEAYTFLFKRKLGCSCCEKLFKKKLFANLKFKKGIQGEDLELLYRLIDRVNRVVCINKAKYHYVHRENSITTAAFNDRSMDIIYTMEDILKFIDEKYPTIIKQAYGFQMMWLTGNVRRIYRSGGRKKFVSEYQYIYHTIISNLKTNLFNSSIYIGDYILMWGIILHMYIPTQWILDKSVHIYHRISGKE